MAVEGRSNVVLNMHAQQDFLVYGTRPVSVHLVMVCSWLLVQQFFSLFAQLKTTSKSQENYVFLHPFSSMVISPQNNVLVNCMGRQVCHADKFVSFKAHTKCHVLFKLQPFGGLQCTADTFLLLLLPFYLKSFHVSDIRPILQLAR